MTYEQIDNDEAYDWLLENGEEDDTAAGRAATATRSRPDEVTYGLAVLPKSEFDEGYGSIMTDNQDRSLVCGGHLRDVMTHVWTGDGWQQLAEPLQLSSDLFTEAAIGKTLLTFRLAEPLQLSSDLFSSFSSLFTSARIFSIFVETICSPNLFFKVSSSFLFFMFLNRKKLMKTM